MKIRGLSLTLELTIVYYLSNYIYIYIQGGRQKSTPQIVSDNFEQWTARIKIENDLQSRRLRLKHIKQQIVWKSMNGKKSGPA